MEIRKKYIVLVLIPSLLIQFCGCYSMKEIPKEEIVTVKEGGDIIVYTKDSTIYFFEKSNYQISNDSINGKGYAKFSEASDFKAVKSGGVALTNIETLQQDELNLVTTSLLVGGILLAVILGAALLFTKTSESAVFVIPTN
jgi:hypothetical protein